MEYLLRRWRVEAALCFCYWHALDRDDRSIRYCANHSLLLSVVWLAALIDALMPFGATV